MSVREAIQTALQHHQAGQLREAEALYRRALSVEPDNADALHLLGLVAYQTGRHQEAIQLIEKAILFRPFAADFHNHLGEAWRALGRVEQAEKCCRRAIVLKADCAEAHFNLGNALFAQSRLDEAIASYERAVALKPDYAQAHNNLGNALRQKGETEAALLAYRNAVRSLPTFAEGHNNLGVLMEERGQLAEAMAAFRRSVALKPDYAEAWNNLGAALSATGQPAEAIAAHRRAIELRPDFAEAYDGLGLALQQQDRLEEAIAAHRKAIAIRPDSASAFCNLAVALRDSAQYDAALACCEKAIAIRPDFAEAHWNRALHLLLRADLETGWKEYEWRWKWRGFTTPRRDFGRPQWRGEDLRGRKILLHAEQGLGDMIQFVRYAPLLTARGARPVPTCSEIVSEGPGPAGWCGARVIVECHPELRRLFRSLEGVEHVMALGEPPPDFDFHSPIMSLPLACGTTLETIPRNVPYLRADKALVGKWREKIEADGGAFRVGLAWTGNPANKWNRRRSLPLSALAPLANAQGVRFYSLQKGYGADEAGNAPANMKLIDLMQAAEDFADTAALMANLDLIITIETAVAHLAGALGRPVWTLLSFVPDWRWLLERDDSPWYPTMRLFRQPAVGDWRSVVRRLALELDSKAKTCRA